MPRVSVIMPCYNAAPFVRAAIDSVLAQSWRDLELIVVDDGSTDGSAAILAAVDDPRVTVLRQANAGQCAACNAGLARATGELIKFFDADDVMNPDMVRLQVERIGGREDVIAFGEWRRFYAAAPDDGAFPPLATNRDATPVDWLIESWRDARPMMQCGLFLIPRAILNARGGWDERLSLINDFEFFARVLIGARHLLFCPGARLHYRSAVVSSLSGRKSRKAVESQYLSLMLGTQHLLAACDTPQARRSCAAVFADFDYAHFPKHPDLRAQARARVADLGGSDLSPDGPPGFHRLRRFIGWRAARLVERAVAAMRRPSGPTSLSVSTPP